MQARCNSKSKIRIFSIRETFNKPFKKDDKNKKVIKHDNDLVYKSVHNFNKYSLSNFNEILSINSKFDIINKFYKDLVKLNNVRNKNENAKQKK